MRFLARFTGLLALSMAGTLLTACADGARPEREAWSPTGGGLRWSAVEQGPKRPAEGKASASPRSEDLNGDGYDDFAGYGKDRILVVYGSPAGLDPRTRTTVRAIPRRPSDGTEVSPSWVRADLDHDGYTDLVADFDGRALVLWSGPGGIQKVTRFPGRGGLWTGDFDGDGKPDLFRLGTDEASAGTVLYGPFQRNGEGARRQTLKRRLPKESVPHEATVGDFDGDSTADLAVRTRWTDPDSEGDGDLTYHGMRYYRGSEKGLVYDAERSGDDVRRAYGLPADVDGDGVDDVTRVSLRSGQKELRITTRRGDSSSGRTTVLSDLPGLDDKLPFYGGVAGPAIGDVTGDGKVDLVVGAHSANENRGVVFLLRDLTRPEVRNLQAVDLQSPGVPGKDRKYVRNRFSPLPPLLDVDGDGHLDVIATAKLGGYWTLPGTKTGLDTTATRRITPGELR